MDLIIMAKQLPGLDHLKYQIEDTQGTDLHLIQNSYSQQLDPLGRIGRENEQSLNSLEPSINQLDDFERLKIIRARTLQNLRVKPTRIACVGVIEPLGGIDPISESKPAPSLIDEPKNVELDRPTDETTEEVLMTLRELYDTPKIIVHKFRPNPGDVIIAAKPKGSSLQLDDVEPTTTMSMEAKPLEFYPSNDPSHLNGLVSLYEDSFYFIDEREYRRSVSDVYEFQQGDIVARLGYFNELWHWSHACTFAFYLYYPKRVQGECCHNPNEMGPWYLLNNMETSQTGGFEADPPPKPEPTITPNDLPPFSILPYGFDFKDGDILIHQTNDRTLFQPWNVGLTITVENSKNRGGLQKIVHPLDKVLRYGIHAEHSQDVFRESSTIYVELFQFYGGSEWKFLGKYEALYNHVATLPALIRFNVNTPQPGDIFIKRRCCRGWDGKLQTGGAVEIYRDESFFDLLKEPREKLQNYRWGIGDDTTIVRFGSFANREWTWMPKPSVDIFILNGRGNSLRRHCRIPWQDQWRPKANYNFSLDYDLGKVWEGPVDCKPRTGDLIIRYLGTPWPSSDLVWDDEVLDQNNTGEPSVRIEFFNELHMVGGRLANGDWLLRVGYERSDRNRHWTHVTAELFRRVKNPYNRVDKFWEFKGRDIYVFGALLWPEKHGLFSGNEEDRPYADPDDDFRRDRGALETKSEADHSRTVRLFLGGLGYPILDDALDVPGCLLV